MASKKKDGEKKTGAADGEGKPRKRSKAKAEETGGAAQAAANAGAAGGEAPQASDAPATPTAVADEQGGQTEIVPSGPKARPEIRIVRMKVPIPLSIEERLSLADKRMRLDARTKKIKLDRTLATQEFNKQLATVEKEIDETVETWNRGSRDEERDVEVQIDFVGSKKMFIHPTTGNVFKVEPLSTAERQLYLGQDTHGTPLQQVAPPADVAPTTDPKSSTRSDAPKTSTGNAPRFNLETMLVRPTSTELDIIKRTEVGARLRLRGQLFEKVASHQWVLLEQTGSLKEAIGEQLEAALAKARTSELESAGFDVQLDEPTTFPHNACVDCAEKETDERPLFEFEDGGPRRCETCFDVERQRRAQAHKPAETGNEWQGLPIIDRRDGREIGRARTEGPLTEARYFDDAPHDLLSLLVARDGHYDYLTDPAEIALATAGGAVAYEQATNVDAAAAPASSANRCTICQLAELRTMTEREFRKCEHCMHKETRSLREGQGTLPAQPEEAECGRCEAPLSLADQANPALATGMYGQVCSSCFSLSVEEEEEAQASTPAAAKIECADCGNEIAADDINVRPNQEGVFCAGCAVFYCETCGVRLSSPAKSCLDCYNAAATAHPPVVMA